MLPKKPNSPPKIKEFVQKVRRNGQFTGNGISKFGKVARSAPRPISIFASPPPQTPSWKSNSDRP